MSQGPSNAKTRLVVLYGGQSAEHDVSCTTARHVLAAIDRDRFAVESIGIGRDGTWKRTDAASLLSDSPAALPPTLSTAGSDVTPTSALARGSGEPALVVLPLLHGPMGEDGTIQGLLELAGVPYVGSGVLGSAACMDKTIAKQLTAANGITQPLWRTVHADEIDGDTPATLHADLGPVLFIKPANMGSSVGVSRSTGPETTAAALHTAASFDEWVVVEEAIQGREIEVGVLGNRTFEASVVGEIVPGDTFYSYDDKYVTGVADTVIPADLTNEQADEVRGLARRAAAALRVDGLARVDFFFESPGRGFLLNEINTMPGFTPISMFPKLWHASGLSYPDLINRLVDLAIERHELRQQHRSTER